MEEGAEPTKNDVIDMAQARPERKLVENPLTWWGDTPWCMWNFNYGASRAPAPYPAAPAARRIEQTRRSPALLLARRRSEGRD